MEQLHQQYQQWASQTGDQVLLLISGLSKDEINSPTESWPLADFPSALAIVIAYLIFVTFGRIVMTFLPSFHNYTYSLRFFYNIIQVMLCSYMTIESLLLAYRNGYTVVPCNPFNVKNPPLGNLLWLFYISKVLDFFDTIFIVLGKKWKQLSFLHVYHHSTIFLMYWVNTRVGYDGDIFLTILLNGLIHTVMYTYYFVSLHTKDIWWKKYLTALQMVQFLTMNAQAIYLLVTDCQTGFPKRVTQVYLFYIITLFFLFLQFFISSYCKPKKKRDTKKEE